MRQPPPLNTCLRYPITTSLAAFAIMATLQFWNGADIARFEIGLDDWWREPWRFLTPVLFHVNTIHLIFNLYWLWVFGTQIEFEFGSGRTLGIYALLAAGSNAADTAIFGQGIGLSGVGYGLFGLLWVLSRTDTRFRDSMDKQTVQLMVGWFFLCIVLTVTNVMGVANVAHGAGCVLGALLGWTIGTRKPILRLRNAAVLGVVFLLFMAGGTVARPYVNLSKGLSLDLFIMGNHAMKKNDPHRAISLYEKALAINPNMSDCWNNLGIAYDQVDRKDDSERAFQRVKMLEPDRK